MQYPNRIPFLFIALVLCVTQQLLSADDSAASVPDDELFQRGQALYQATCADCHGGSGEGATGAYEEPLIGDNSIGQLAELIGETMPEGEPEACVGEDALAVATYIHYSFYSDAAQLRNRPPRISLARLTGNQLRQSLSDLYAVFDGVPPVTAKRGAQGKYYEGDRARSSNLKFDRVDPVIDFDFGRESPGEGIKPEAFAIEWDGAILADVTGRYEIVVHSTCSFVLEFGRRGRELINNHVQSGDKTEFRRALNLTAGRAYPFHLSFRQRERKTELPPANISFRWVPPGGIEHVIPTRNLLSEEVPAAYALQANLPPDDRSYGFERGVAINRQWDDSTTAAAIEFAHIAFDELWPAYRRQHRNSSQDQRAQLKEFLAELVSTAFRGRWDEDLRSMYVDRQVDAEPNDLEAIKRVMLVALKSAHFLYPTIDADASASQRAANRLALVMFDSLPVDRKLRELAERGELSSAEKIREYVAQHIDDYRVRAKTREFLYEWLNLGRLTDITKDKTVYPGFDQALADDMRRSLDAFLDDVIWGEASDFRQLFSADWSYSTPRIAEFLGEPWQAAGDGSSEQKLFRTPPAPELRFGLLTHPYLLSGLAYYDSTSPIHRGVFLMRHVLGRTLRPPAEAFTPLSPDLHPDLTTRERVSLQTSPESCQVCHSKINGLGFTLENFDAVGRFRSTEREKPIESTGSYTTRAGEVVHFTGPADLAAFLIGSDDSHRAFVSKAFQHFVKQPPAAFGPTTLDDLTQKFRNSDFSVRQLLIEIAVVACTQAASEPELS